MKDLALFTGYCLMFVAGLFMGFIITVENMALEPQPIFSMSDNFYSAVVIVFGLMAIVMIAGSRKLKRNKTFLRRTKAAYYMARLLGYICAAISSITAGSLWAITVEKEDLYLNNYFYLQSPLFYYVAIVILLVIGMGSVFISKAIPDTEQAKG